MVGLITVKKFDIANPVCKCSTSAKSLLVAPWSLTLAGPLLAGSNSKPHDYTHKKTKNEGPSGNEFHKKNRLSISDEEKVVHFQPRPNNLVAHTAFKCNN